MKFIYMVHVAYVHVHMHALHVHAMMGEKRLDRACNHTRFIQNSQRRISHVLTPLLSLQKEDNHILSTCKVG